MLSLGSTKSSIIDILDYGTLSLTRLSQSCLRKTRISMIPGNFIIQHRKKAKKYGWIDEIE